MTVANSLSRRDDERVAKEILARVRARVQPSLDEAVKRVSPDLRAAVDHHLLGGGKYVRAGLVLLAAAAAGADDDAAIVGALAIELVHNFSLIHDDIIDGDLERRHHPTVWAQFGIGSAVISGDALCTLAFQLLLDDPTPERVQAAIRLGEATQAMIAGQAEDMESESRSSLSVEECLRMEAGKTGALLSCAASIGAVLVGANASTVDALADYGRHVGVAFQAVDDVLGIWGQSHVTGKPVGSDLRRRKKTLPISIANAQGVDVFAVFPESLEQEPTDAEIQRAMALLEECGAREATMEICEANLRAALASLERTPLAEGPSSDLGVIARYVIGRDQ